jgi:hypothetical protein
VTGRIALVGADHNHLYEIIDRLVKAGAEAVAHTADGAFVEHYAGWRPVRGSARSTTSSPTTRSIWWSPPLSRTDARRSPSPRSKRAST